MQFYFIYDFQIPASAVEMPGYMMTTLDVQFGNLEFGSDSSAFSFRGNESVNSAFTSADSNRWAWLSVVTVDYTLKYFIGVEKCQIDCIWVFCNLKNDYFLCVQG